MAHPFTPDFRLNNFDAALLADHATVTHALVFAAITFVIFGRTEDLGAKQTIALRLEGPVIDSFRFFSLRHGTKNESCPADATEILIALKLSGFFGFLE
jgi:hypothetical protein